MSKAYSWNVIIDGRTYDIKYKDDIYVNGRAITKLDIRRELNATKDFQFSVGMKTAHLYKRPFAEPQLVIGGKDCATGENYEPQVLPKWSYIFLVLHLFNFKCGILGILLASAGLAATSAVSGNKKIPTVMRILFDVGILLGIYIIVFTLGGLIIEITY